MSRAVASRILFCLLLGASSTAFAAREVRLHGPNGDGGGCSDDASATSTTVAAPKPTVPAATSHPKAKPVIGVRGGGSDDGIGISHAPRWHSFLPGMFR